MRAIKSPALCASALAGALLVACGTPARTEDPDPPAPTRTGGRPPSTATGGSGVTPPGTGGAAPAGTGGTVTPVGTGGTPPAGTGGAGGTPSPSPDVAAETAPPPPPPGDGGLGGLGPGSADDSPPLVLPGSKLIFDGKTLMGWMPCDPARWSVKDGAIDGNGSGNNFCQTATDHDTFRITGKSRMVRDPSNHAGICFWGGRGAGGGGCLQVTPVSGSLWDYGGGGGLRTLPRTRDYSKWNFFEMLVDATAGTMDIAVEGQAYPTFKARAGRAKKGPIGLQLHAGSNEVQSKDLAIEDNPTVKKLLTAKP